MTGELWLQTYITATFATKILCIQLEVKPEMEPEVKPGVERNWNYVEMATKVHEGKGTQRQRHTKAKTYKGTQKFNETKVKKIC